jgi:serine/threonine protein kinase
MISHTDLIDSLGYKVVEELGFGTFSVVYKVMGPKGIEAIKLPRERKDFRITKGSEDAPLPDYWRRLEHIDRERMILGEINDIPGVAQLNEQYEWRGHWTTAIRNTLIERIPYVDRIVALRKKCIIGKKMREEDKLSEEGKSFLENTVHSLHGRGIAIGDLKRSNLIVDESGKPYIVDMGISRMRHEVGFYRAFEHDKWALEFIVTGRISNKFLA